VATPSVGQSRVAFGLFEADLFSGELYRSGRKVPLQDKPYRILALLLERPGEIVTREELCKHLWPEGTFVDFDEGLDTALKKLRHALGDSAQNPTFIQTIPRRGYRFIAPVSKGSSTAPLPTFRNPPAHPAPSIELSAKAPTRRYTLALIAAALLLAGIYGAFRWRSQAREFDLRRMQVTQLTDSGQVKGIAISPDGRYVVYARGAQSEGSLWLREMATRHDVQLLPTGPAFHGLTFSPDGQSIYFVRSDENDPAFKYLYNVPTHGGTVARLITDVDSPVSFSPDGTRFVYEHCVQPRNDIDLKVANADGSNDHLLTTIHDGSGELYQPGPNWSPDGQTIAVPVLISNQHLRWVLDVVSVANGAIRELYSSQQEDLGRPVWLRSGTALMLPHFDKAAHRSQLWTVSFPEGRAQPLTHDLSDYGTDLDQTRDGRTLATTASTLVSHVWIAPASDLSQGQQVTSDDLPMLDVAEAFDGKLLVHSADDAIWMMHTDGSQRIRFTDVQTADELTTCGQSVILRIAENGTLTLTRFDKDGSHPTVLARGSLTSPACSADASAIFYYTWDQPQRIWKVLLEGGSPQPVAEALGDTIAGSLVASPDGKFLAYPYTQFGRVPSVGWRIALIPVTGAPPFRQFATPAESYGVLLRWSPGGQGLQYLVTHSGVTNIWEQPLSGAAPKQLTHFTAGQIFDFNWSLDHTRLLLTRGNQNSDAVLLTH